MQICLHFKDNLFKALSDELTCLTEQLLNVWVPIQLYYPTIISQPMTKIYNN